ncbi:MAG: SDR family NAD(P)-dependent oxidoreductase, partial [Nevskia sp.]|nr:SDR family NAD(P)-dependent oxidoreductase [Nevskia sp.]
LEETARAIAAAGGTAPVEVLDVQDEASVRAAFERAGAALGPVDILINNAGANRPQAAVTMPLEDWDAIVDTNLRGAFLMARSFAAALIAAARPGAIVNIASVLGLRVQKGVSAYAASKAALLQLTRQLALEWARHRIRVNALVPGYFHTDITGHFLGGEEGRELVQRIPARRVGAPEELAGPLLLLAGPGSAYMTGAEIAVDGGLLCSSL